MNLLANRTLLNNSSNSTPLARVYRGGRIEGLHHGAVAVTDASGHLLFSVNNPDYSSYPRSSIKMIQALPVVLSGAADRFGFTERELAVCVASHTGARYHLDAVHGMLEKIGMTEADLGCGAHDPDDRSELQNLMCSNHKPSQIHNNCSGKHAGMLASCLAMNWPTAGYFEQDHPLQQWIHQLMADHAGLPPDSLGIGIDGCSLPTFYMPIASMSRVLARFTADAFNGDTPAGRIFRAVAAHPEMINAFGGFDTELVRVLGGRGIAKRGAMAVFIVGINTERYGPIGITVKIEDGNSTPMPVIVMRVLEEIGAITPDEAAELQVFREMPLRNWRGIDVGEIRAEFDVKRVG
jgi:L-asparaginase II